MILPNRVAIILWILSILPPVASRNCSLALIEEVNSTLHFDSTYRSWYDAENACDKEGGQLLNELNCAVRAVIQQESSNYGPSNTYQWWVSHHVRNDSSALDYLGISLPSGRKEGQVNNCTYITSDFHVVTTPFCRIPMRSICVFDFPRLRKKREAEADYKDFSRNRIKRTLPITLTPSDIDATLANLSTIVGNISFFVQEAADFLELVEQGRINPTFTQMSDFLQYLLEASLLVSTVSLANKTTIASMLYNYTGAVLYFVSTYCSGNPFSSSQKVYIIHSMFKIYQVLSLQLANSSEGVIRENSVCITNITRQTPQQLFGSTVKVPGNKGYIALPSFSSLGPALNQLSHITVEMVSFKVNPFPDDSEDVITGAICSLALSSNNQEIHVNNLADQIEIFLPRDDAPTLSSETVIVQRNTLVTTAFNVSDTNHTIILTMKPYKDISLHLQLAYGGPPNGSNVKSSTVLDWQDGYRWLITPEMFWAGTGAWYVQASVINPPSGLNITMEISAFPTKCVFWNVTLESWSTMGCTVGPQSELNLTQCLCNHLTTFGSSIFVMPNQVDLSQTAEYFATVTNNYVVVVLLSVFFGLYLMALVWACHADRHASRKRKITWLGDSTFCAQYCYLLSVHTGHRSGAGTSAQVEMTFIGSEGESELHHLKDPDKPLFERGGVDMFLLTTPFPLGELQSIRVSHDNSGGHPSWYLSKIMVQDLQTRQYWHFLCSTWLSSTKGEGMIKRTFHVAQNSQITSFGNIFQTRTSTGFRDEHIWVSVVDPPRRSPFTRAQRVSCCMCILLCTMAINIMFWNVPQDKNSPVIFSIGSITLTLQEFMVGIESGLLMFPINILIITIFRYTKPRHSPAKDTQHTMQDQKTPPVTTATFLKDTERFITILSMCPKNNVAALEIPLEKWSDLFPALDCVQGLLQLMQVKENDFHWVYCSQFVFFSLRRLAETFNKLDVKAFHWEENYWKLHNTITHLVKQADMVATRYMETGPIVSAPESEKKKGCWLPWWFVFIGWFLLLSISGVSTFFTLLYGFNYGKESSIKWVISLGLSLFQSIFILQPLKVVGVAIFFALIVKTVVVEDSDEAKYLLSEQRKKIASLTGKALP